MPKSFDKQLSNKIRSTFENYNEPFNNDAWKLMQQKLDTKKKKRFILFINIAKAASIILFVGIGVLWPYKTNHQFSNSNKSTLIKDSSLKNEKGILKNNELLITEEYKNQPNTEQIKQKIIIKNNSIKNIYIAKSEQNTTADKLVVDSTKVEEKQEKEIFANLIKTLNKDTINNETIVDTVKDKHPVLTHNDKDFFKEKKADKKFKFGIAVSSHYSSSEIGAVDKVNVGGGFLTSYAVSDNVSLSSGLLLSNHNMKTGQNLKRNNEVYLSENSSLTEKTETLVLLVGVDIPLNVQINFNKISLSTGVSSLFYLKESYSKDYYTENTTKRYNYDSNSYDDVYYYDTENSTQTRKAFKTFDFAKLFNLSIGYKIPLKKGHLIFEPYAKIPLGNLTSYNILYGYGGVALKYDF